MFLEIWGLDLLIILSFVTLLWLVSLVKRDASIVDIFWGMGFVLLTAVNFTLTDGYPLRSILITALVTIWGLRLSIHILVRNWGKGEDFRYRAWRQQAGNKFWWTSFFKVFLLQGGLIWLIGTPIIAAQSNNSPAYLTFFDFLGLGFWSIGFFFEAVGDWQLIRFKQNPANKGKLLQTGLWAFTRHPNYFGDAMVWWGFFLIALSTPWGIWALFSPLIMTGLLMKVSGVAMLERTLKMTKPGYEEYMQNTNAFFPGRPGQKLRDRRI